MRNGAVEPFTSTQLLPAQSDKALTPAPLSGEISHDQAMWIEQLISPEIATSAWQMAWRLMIAPAEGGGEARELLSSLSLTGRETLPVASGWISTATDGKSAFMPATVPSSEKPGTFEDQITEVSTAKPGVVVTREQGRLPATIGDEVAWIRDTTANGPDADRDSFALHWAHNQHSDMLIETGDYFKVHFLAGDDHFIVLVLQDQCSARTWMGRFDRVRDQFTGWVYTLSDGIALSLNGSVAVWGNGSGNIGARIYRWDLTTDMVSSAGENEGFSVPFSAGDTFTAVRSFGMTVGGSRVQWTLVTPEQ